MWFAVATASTVVPAVFGVGHGLPQRNVTDIAFGPDGALWVTTEGGAARFDGQRFHPLDLNDPAGRAHLRLTDVEVAPDGRVWFLDADGFALLYDTAVNEVLDTGLRPPLEMLAGPSGVGIWGRDRGIACSVTGLCRASTAERPGAGANGGDNLTLAAVLAATGVALPSGAKWRVKALPGGPGEAQGEVGADAFERTFERAVVDTSVPPGHYEVTLETRAGHETRTIAIEDGQPPVEIRVELDGGFLDIRAIAPAAGGLAPVATVEALEGRDGAPGDVVWSGPINEVGGFLLTAGRYRVSLADGLKRTAQMISLKAGEARTLALDFNPGRLNVRVEGLDARQRGAAVIEIAADDPTAPEGRRLLTRSAAGWATFSLAPGTYHVTLDVLGSRQTEIVVLPGGKTVETRLALGQMALTVASYIGPTNEVAEANVRYRVWRADNVTRPIRVAHEAEPVFYLAPGKYRIESRIGQQNAVIIREFDIARQGKGKLPLRHEAGSVTFTTPDGEAIADTTAYWELTDQSGRLVWRTIAASPVMTLAAGLYDVEVQSAQKTYRGKFLVVAGHDQTVTLSDE